MKETRSAVESKNASRGAAEPRRAVSSNQVCPFCGNVSDRSDLACAQCGMEDTPGTRQATRSKVGPWHVLQQRNPAAPGMNHATLIGLIQKGRVTARSVLRGPTTHQLWKFAGRVKGISREFGVCWGCGASVARNARMCPECKRLQEPPLDPDSLLEAKDERLAPIAAAVQPAQPAQPEPSAASADPSPRVQIVHLGDPAGHMEMAAFQLGAHRKSHRVLKSLAASVLVAVGMLSVVFYLNPALWRQARAWGYNKWQDLAGDPRPTNTQGVPPPIHGSALPPAAQDSSPRGNQTNIAVGPRIPSTNPVVPPQDSTTRIAPANPRPSGPEIIVSPPKPPLTGKAAMDRADELRTLAYDAMNRKDWPAAVKCWEEMKQLPREAWHSDMDQKLDLCRQNAGQKP